MPDTRSASGRITALEPQKRHPDRVSLFLDGRFACGLSQMTALDHGLHVGIELTSEAFDALLGDEESRHALDAAYLLLSYRARSTHEISARLLHKGFAPQLVEQVTDDLIAAGLLDDTAFAESWVRSRQETRPRGGALLRHELRQKGVSKETTEAALESLDPQTEIDAAHELAQRQCVQLRDLDPRVRRRRIIGRLQRRGFSWETIRDALASLDDFDVESE